MTTDDLLKQGIAALNAGRKAEAGRLLMQVVQQDERNEMAWLWLSGAVDTNDERRICLENVLAINPNNGVARRGIEALRKSSPELAFTPDATFREGKGSLQSIRGTTIAEIREALQQAAAAIKSGDEEGGKQLLLQVLEQDESNEIAWLWMTRCIADRDVKRECLERVLAINPDNEHAIEGLKRLEVLSKVETPASPTKRKKPTKKQATLIIGLGAGVLVIACIGIASIWWAINSGLLQLGPAAPAAVDITQVSPTVDATSTPVPSPTSPPTWTPAPRLTNTPAPTRTPRPTNTPRPTRTPFPPTPTAAAQTLGPIWNTSRDESYTARISFLGARFSTGEGWDTPRAGYVFVVVDLTVENLGPSPMRYVAISDFQMLHEDGALYDYEFVGDSSDCHLPGVDLMAGGSTSGCVGFEIPMSGSLELIYAPYKYEGLQPGRYLSFTIRE